VLELDFWADNFFFFPRVILRSSATRLQINRRVFKMGHKSKKLSEDRKQLVVDLKREGHRNCEIVKLLHKRVTQDSLKLCSSFYYNEKHWWQFQLAKPIAVIFLFSRILMRQHCIYICLKMKPNSVRIRFLSWQIFFLPSTGFTTNCNKQNLVI
jgi:hypothetical protein